MLYKMFLEQTFRWHLVIHKRKLIQYTVRMYETGDSTSQDHARSPTDQIVQQLISSLG